MSTTTPSWQNQNAAAPTEGAHFTFSRSFVNPRVCLGNFIELTSFNFSHGRPPLAKKGKIADSRCAREAARYDNPIPSREVILELLNAADSLLRSRRHRRLAGPGGAGASMPAQTAARHGARWPVDGQPARDYGSVDKMNLLHCKGAGASRRLWFAIPVAAGEEDVYLSAAR